MARRDGVEVTTVASMSDAIFVEDPRTVDNLIFQNFIYRLQHVSLGGHKFPGKAGTAKFLRPRVKHHVKSSESKKIVELERKSFFTLTCRKFPALKFLSLLLKVIEVANHPKSPTVTDSRPTIRVRHSPLVRRE